MTLNPKDDHPVDHIYRSLHESLQWACSTDQMELCKTYGILNSHELQRFRKCALQLPQIDRREIEDWTRTMAEYTSQLHDRYVAHMEAQYVRQLGTDEVRARLLVELQQLSAQLEDSGFKPGNKNELLEAFRQLRNNWRNQRKADTEKIILSIISSMQLSSRDCRIIKADRSHWKTLGLGLGSIDKHYLVFESGMHPDDDKERSKTIIRAIARDFGCVFEENVAQNMTRIQNSYYSFQLTCASIDELSARVQRLSNQLFFFNSPSTMWIHEQYDQSNVDQTTKGYVCQAKMSSHNLFDGAHLEFQPAAWDWPHLLKFKTPGGRKGRLVHRLARALTPTLRAHEEEADTTTEGFWTISIGRLAQRFNKDGQVYYASMLNNAILLYAHQFRLFERVMGLLLKCHGALQLEHGYENLARSLALIQKLKLETRHRNSTVDSLQRSSFFEM